MTGYPPVVRSATGSMYHDPGCRYLRRMPRPVTPTADAWQALGVWRRQGRDYGAPAPWADCCAARVAALLPAPSEPPEPRDPTVADDCYLGTVVLALCEKAAAAWAVGRVEAAERFFTLAGGLGRFTDEVPLDPELRREAP